MLATAHAAPVTWITGPTEITSEASIIIPAGATVYHAGTWGNPPGSAPLTVPVTGDTITFERVGTGNAIGNLSAVATGGSYYSGEVWLPTGTVDPNFELVMDSSAVDGDNPKSVQVGGLTIGTQYRLQLFISDDRGCCNGRTLELSDNATDGAGTETTSFTTGSSSYVIGSFTASATSQTVYVRGLAQAANYINAYVLVDMSVDTDGDKIPDHIEAQYSFLNANLPSDAALDKDSDGLSNLEEYRKRLNLDNPDTDGDGLTDGEEVNPPPGVLAPSNPAMVDTDGDTLSDYAEVKEYFSNPTLQHSDNDLFPDRWEAAAGSQLTDPNSTPNGTQVTRLGTGPAAMLGFDLTDPEGNGSDVTNTGFNWVAVTSSQGGEPSSSTENSGGNVFDNKVGGGEAKWCCAGAPQHVTVQFAAYTSLQYFTITNSEDNRNRDPRVWEIQGSNDGIHFAPITRFDFPSDTLWSETSQGLRVNLPANSLPYRYIRYQVYATAGGEHALCEIEYFGAQNNNDGDGDGIPQLYEVLFPDFLSDGNFDDAAADQDEDGLSNFEEFQAGTNPQLDDSDSDGLTDDEEVNPPDGVIPTNPLDPDSDDDGLTDYEELNPEGDVSVTDPMNPDTDGDLFRDGYEVDRGSDPNSSASGPDGMTAQILGGLLQRDFTDRQNDGNDSTLAGSGFDWVSISASSKADFAPAEGAFNVFDNKTGGGEAKWCCDPAPQSITVQTPFGVELTHFTLTSSNDSPDRDPRIWSIQGSNDGTTFTNIVNHTDPTTLFWGEGRNRTVQFTLATKAPMYKWFRYSVTATNGNQHALAEIEYFGEDQDSDGDLLPDYFESQYGVANPGDNPDNDGLTNLEEYEAGLIPTDPDTDNDGLTDGDEYNEGGTGTDPKIADTDLDQINDGYEVRNGSDPLDFGSLPTFAPIDWAGPANISGNLSDFKTTGTLIHAWTGGTAAINVPGVANFTPGPSLGAPFTGYDPFNRNLNADYETLINTGTFSGATGRFVEIPNLTVGEDYRVQIWVVDTRPGFADRTYRYGNVGNEQVVLNAGASGSEATKPGQWVTGTFTAIDTIQYIYMDRPAPEPGAQYNAITVYNEDVIVTTPLRVTSANRVGGTFQITVTGFDITKNYQLTRSTTLAAGSFAPVGGPFLPTGTTQVVTDPSPPALPSKAFYKIQDVP
ncbi:discoidin domain-containing protein [Luteolibacter sp. Populi]|uniref:discoidin domain-containing protein n=1 Tax=Luteolibacter sp. Populi TaxID=3230487 RepID=UPI003466B5F6